MSEMQIFQVSTKVKMGMDLLAEEGLSKDFVAQILQVDWEPSFGVLDLECGSGETKGMFLTR